MLLKMRYNGQDIIKVVSTKPNATKGSAGLLTQKYSQAVTVSNYSEIINNDIK